MQGREQRMLMLKGKAESKKATLQKELKQVAKEREEARKQQEQLDKAIAKTCSMVPDVKVYEDEAPTEKVTKLTLAIKD